MYIAERMIVAVSGQVDKIIATSGINYNVEDVEFSIKVNCDVVYKGERKVTDRDLVFIDSVCSWISYLYLKGMTLLFSLFRFVPILIKKPF